MEVSHGVFTTTAQREFYHHLVKHKLIRDAEEYLFAFITQSRPWLWAGSAMGFGIGFRNGYKHEWNELRENTIQGALYCSKQEDPAHMASRLTKVNYVAMVAVNITEYGISYLFPQWGPAIVGSFEGFAKGQDFGEIVGCKVASFMRKKRSRTV